MKIKIFDDDTPPDGPLFERLAQLEKKLAEEEKREPEGWVWTGGMNVPRSIDFDALGDENDKDAP